VADTLGVDVSKWQVGVNDSYPYPVLCIRSNDGTHRDRRWVNNYGWCLRNADSGRLTFFIVYFVWRPNWQQEVDTAKVIGYGDAGDLNSVWPRKPPGVRLVVAACGNNPPYPGKVAHQYTDGCGYGGGLTEGAPPFGRRDMNSADGLTAVEFARACGVTATDSVPNEVVL